MKTSFQAFVCFLVIAINHISIAQEINLSEYGGRTVNMEVTATDKELGEIALLLGVKLSSPEILYLDASISYVNGVRDRFYVEHWPQAELKLDKLCVIDLEFFNGAISGDEYRLLGGNTFRQYFAWLSDQSNGCHAENHIDLPDNVGVLRSIPLETASLVLENKIVLFEALREYLGGNNPNSHDEFRLQRLDIDPGGNAQSEACAHVTAGQSNDNYMLCFTISAGNLKVLTTKLFDIYQ